MKKLNYIFNILLRNNDAQVANGYSFSIQIKFIKPFLHYNNVFGMSKFVTGKYLSTHYFDTPVPSTK